MATIRKRVLDRAGKDVRWDVIIEVKGGVKRARKVRSFFTQKEAKEYEASIGCIQPRASAHFKALTDQFLKAYEDLVGLGKREASTVTQLRQHINLHILPDTEFSKLKCGDIGTQEAQEFLDRLVLKVSAAMATKVRATLSQVFAYGARRGFTASNPMANTKLEASSRPDIDAELHISLPEEPSLKALLKTAKSWDNTGKAEALVRLLMYGGLRASELRGLRWTDLNLESSYPKVAINQKADRFNKIGKVKSKDSKREVPLGQDTVLVLKNWKESAGTGKYVFGNEEGKPWSYPNLWNRFWVPLMNKAGLVTVGQASKTVRNWSDKQVDFKQPAFGLHMLRHVYASLQIKQGVSPKRLQKLMGHSTMKLTMDTYGHLWPDDKADQARASAVEKALFAG